MSKARRRGPRSFMFATDFHGTARCSKWEPLFGRRRGGRTCRVAEPQPVHRLFISPRIQGAVACPCLCQWLCSISRPFVFGKLMMARRARYTSTRPRAGVVEDPRAWWMHSISCVVSDLQGRRSTFSWSRCASLPPALSRATRHLQTCARTHGPGQDQG